MLSSSIVPIVAFLLLDGELTGLGSRPSNTTCLAENIVPAIVLTNVFTNSSFISPLVLKQAPADNSRFFVAEKRGVIQLLVNGVQQSVPFLDISSQVSDTGERGLLGLAFHPNYTANGFFYVSYTDINGDSVISRFSTTNANLADATSELIILTLDQPFSNHNGGQIDFGSDSYLYIGFGDGGAGGDPQNHGQDLSTWLGSMLRIDVNSGSPYGIPATNPYAGHNCDQEMRTGICPEIYAHGLRNPWRWSFDSLTDQLWLGDVGQNSIEEVDIVDNGDNLGWRCYEGDAVYSSSGLCTNLNGAVLPILQYVHEQGRCSITGGYVYRGSAIDALEGMYVYGDYCSREVWVFPADNPAGSLPVQLAQASSSLMSFAQDNQGNIYVLQANNRIRRIDENPNPGSDPIPVSLVDSGCVDSTDITKPATGLIPYDINAPFWSDGAVKSRWLALPNNTRINNSNNDWDFPVGTVLMKNFEVENKIIETRLFKRHTNGLWAGYTYEWNADQTQAIRVVGGKTTTLQTTNGPQLWHFPSENECMVCHTEAAGYSLGLETSQLNKPYTYLTTNSSVNQLLALSQVDMFTHPIYANPNSLPKYPNPYHSSETLTDRSRAWLHTNCSNCHRPAGGTNSNMNLLYSTPLAATNTCNVNPTNGNHGLTNPKLIVPGVSSNSLVHYRANSRVLSKQMPPLATFIIDVQAMIFLGSWIDNLQNCN